MKNNIGQGRKRKSANQKLPPHVYKDRCRYYYRPYKGSLGGKPSYGKPIRLCALDASTSEVWKEYERIISGSEVTLKWLVTEYLESKKCKSLSSKTIDEYNNYSKNILSRKTTNNSTFGDIRLNNISQRTIRRYLDAYSHPIAAAMEIAYLSRARRGEVFSLTKTEIRKDGIYIERSKKSESETTLWSPRLRDAYKLAVSTSKDPVQAYLLFEDSTGQMYKKNALDSQWKRIIDKAKKKGAPLPEKLKQEALDFGALPLENGNMTLGEHFTFHDIKAKGITDHDTNHSGHKSRKMRGVYIRKGVKVDATR